METYEYNVSHITGGYDKSTVSLDDIYQMICDASLDMVCGDSEIKPFADDAVTYLYSGKAYPNMSSNVLITSFENARIIDKTEVDCGENVIHEKNKI